MAGEDPNCCDLTGSTAMVAAATNQHGDVVKRLFKAGGDVNMTDRNVRRFVGDIELLSLFLTYLCCFLPDDDSYALLCESRVH